MKNFLSLLLVTLALFCSSCKKKKIIIEDKDVTVIPDFSWTGAQTAPAEITFNNLSKNASTYKWDFGNGTTSDSENPGKIKFNQPGKYTVILKANNISVQHDIVITADANPSASFSYSFKDNKSYAPAVVKFVNESVNADSYEWVINGTTSTFKTPADYTFNNAGNYAVKLTAIKSTTRSTVFEQIITVDANPNPIAKFVLGSSQGGYFANQEIFLANQSTNSDSYTWDFGDGVGYTVKDNKGQEHAMVKFSTPGSHIVKLTAKKGALVSQVYSGTITVKEDKPVANFSINSTGAGYYAGLDVQLINLSGNSTNYEWDFGSGIGNPTAENPVVVFNTSGEHTITLTAKKGTLTSTKSLKVKILP